jgi:hypothetical protein
MSVELWSLLAGHRDQAVTAHIESTRFSPLALHAEHQVPPLVALIVHEATNCAHEGQFPYRSDRGHDGPYCNRTEQKEKVLMLARRMLEAGADPNQTAPPNCSFRVLVHQIAQAHMPDGELITRPADSDSYEDYEDYEDYESRGEVDYWQEIPCAGHSALSLAAAMYRQLDEDAGATRSSREMKHDLTEYGNQIHDSNYDIDYSGEWRGIGVESVWKETLGILDALLRYFDEAARHAPEPERVRVAESVVARWEVFLQDSQSHDVTILCVGGEAVTAHARMLELSSPVLATMLSSPLVEGQTKSIPLPDCPAAKQYAGKAKPWFGLL